MTSSIGEAPTDAKLWEATRKCRACGNEVIAAVGVSNGKPLNLEPAKGRDPGGTFALLVAGTVLAYHSFAGTPRYVAHDRYCQPQVDGTVKSVPVQAHTRVVRPRTQDAGAGTQARNNGTAAVTQSDPAFHAWAVETIGKLARAQATFTADDLERERQSVGMRAPNHPNAVGAAFNAASRKGLISGTGTYIRSTTTSAHARRVQVWEKGPKA